MTVQKCVYPISFGFPVDSVTFYNKNPLYFTKLINRYLVQGVISKNDSLDSDKMGMFS